MAGRLIISCLKGNIFITAEFIPVNRNGDLRKKDHTVAARKAIFS
jgi:hypothetical protein